ncbi:transposase family protein, partial [Streptomyces sp. NPDC001276]|uniref:transposase family protein n=1 Tax=Streptomyces sp. NPDC001276 TaxID=3364555 RepID=UPI0036CAEF9D
PGARKRARRVREAAWGNGPVDDTGTALQADFTHPVHRRPRQNRHKTTGQTSSATAQAPGRPDPASLGDPELTGMTVEQLNLLITELTPALEEQREQFRSQQRGGERLRALGAGAKDKLSAPDRILATVLYQRKLGTHELLAEPFGVTRSTLARAVQEVQPLLAKHGHAIRPSTARFRTPADVAAFLTAEPAHPEIKAVRRFSASPNDPVHD